MDFVSSINRFIGLFVDTFKQFGRVRIWLVLLGYFLINWLLLYAHYNFVSPFFYGFISFWTGLFGDQQATGFTHYPGHFLLLPYFFGWAKLFLGILLEGAVLGAVAVMFYQSYHEIAKEERATFRQVFASWIHLELAWLLLNGLILAVNRFLPDLLRPWLAGSPRRTMAFEFAALPLIYVVILAVLFHMIPAAAVYRDHFFRALRRSFRLFLRRPFTSFFLSLLLLTVPVFVSIINGKSADIVQKFKPELVYWLLLAGLIVDVFFYFFWMGTAVRSLVDEEA
jgi:hypothetical protein